MSQNRTVVWVGGTAVVTVLVVLASYFLLIGPQRAEAAELRQQRADTESQNRTLEHRVRELEMDYLELPDRKAELAAIRGQIPQQAALPELVRTLEAIAAEAGVSLQSISPGTPVAVVDPAQAAAPAPAAGADAAAAAAPDAAAQTDAPTTAAPATPAPAGPALAGIPVTVVVTGDFPSAKIFLEKLQVGVPRAFLVEQLGVVADTADGSSGKANGDVTLTITGKVFVLPDANGATP